MAETSARAPVPWRLACEYLRDVAAILGLLHARRLLHRDLSPRNLIETESGRLKLIDFGALADFGPPVEVAGTPPFLAPEALGSEPVDQRSDLFGLGALGYWLITGVSAFPARSLGELPQLWQNEPARASALVERLGRAAPLGVTSLIAQARRASRRSSCREHVKYVQAGSTLARY